MTLEQGKLCVNNLKQAIGTVQMSNEGKKSGARKAEGFSKLFGAESFKQEKIIKSATGAILVGSLLYFLLSHEDSPFSRIEVIDDKNAEAGKHWWHQ